LNDVVGDLRQFIYETGVEIVIQPDMPRVRIGESELQEIFQNLISNAIRAVRGVANPRVIVGYESRSDNHVFSVEDNGVGIPQKYHEAVFKPLFRLASGADGSGLGLSIVRKILKAHAGDIWVNSAPGFGTTFYISLPAA
jgi:signal transduction histidine kinase